MIEIKFRAWDTERKEWFKHGKLLMDIPTGDIYLDILEHKNMFAKRFIISQFTSLKDKNGKEIYEGDILDFHEKEWGKYGFRSVVQWDAESASFDFGGGVVSDINVWRKIIGNIYQNPELLKPTNA